MTLIADTSLSDLRVVRQPDAIIAQRGRPNMIVSDKVLWDTGAEGGRHLLELLTGG